MDAIPAQIKINVRRDYVLGNGLNREIAARYKVSKETVKIWAKKERWNELRAIFSDHDPIIALKQRVMQMDNALAQCDMSDARTVLDRCKALSEVMELYFSAIQLPRRPLAKIERQKTNALAVLMEQASKSSRDEEVTTDVVEVETPDERTPAGAE